MFLLAGCTGNGEQVTKEPASAYLVESNAIVLEELEKPTIRGKKSDHCIRSNDGL